MLILSYHHYDTIYFVLYLDQAEQNIAWLIIPQHNLFVFVVIESGSPKFSVLFMSAIDASRW